MGWTEQDLSDYIARRNADIGLVSPTAVKTAEALKRRRGTMNKWESRYSETLAALLIEGKILWYDFEPFSLRIADGAKYTPDFAVLSVRGLEFHEVKGFWREAARVRIKVAADRFPFPFLAVTRDKRTGEWVYERISGRG